MSIGSPFVKSPLYNQDGYMRYRDNVTRGFHAGLKGCLGNSLRYKFMGSYRKAWGTPSIPRADRPDDFSLAVEIKYFPRFSLSGNLHMRAMVAMDHGSLYGNNIGALIGLSYSGSLNFKK